MSEPQPETKNEAPQDVDPIYSINKGGIGQNRRLGRTALDLIEKEWKIIDDLQKLAENPVNRRQRAFYYQTLASHVRTLSMLLKLHGQADQGQDLARLLCQIDSQVLKLAKRLNKR